MIATEDQAQFDPECPRPQRLFSSERHVVLLVALEDGQQLPAHAPEVDLTLVVTAGVSPPPTADDHARPPKVDWSDVADADLPQP